ncbi:MAG: hypothetical protein AUI53_08060 [Acidobacteria bacterium 13_1_40CM_2_60_7]|nr:MAG: hypothetical protein AUI53_08060 [Acidobacteria bacterium 13_1_40CM_2_60_7]
MGDGAVSLISKTAVPADAKLTPRSEPTKQSSWEETRSVFPIYLALAKLLRVQIPFGQGKRSLPERPTNELHEQVQTWLEQMDQQVQVHQLRHLLQMTTLNASEEGLRGLILRHLRKPTKTNSDRSKIDFLLVQYFALCAPAKIYHKQIELADVAHVMEPVLGKGEPNTLDWCAPLEKMIEALRGFRSLRDILKTNFIEQGRGVKESAGGMFYDAAALMAFTRFNFLLRRTLIELMHADLIAIRTGISHLENSGVRTLDCRNFGLTGAEPIRKIKQIADEWKQPFQKEYTERTVNEAFEKLLGLRADAERALERIHGSTGETSGTVGAAPAAPGPDKNAVDSPAKPSAQESSRSAERKTNDAELDFETCMEKIWEQLIAAPPSRGRSMTTVTVGRARILLSSWEVAAFVSDDGTAAEALRRAVVARVLVTVAMEQAKETGNATPLERALSTARDEVSRLQERIEVAKEAKDTEAAVNLGISTKRLLSLLDQAEKL